MYLRSLGRASTCGGSPRAKWAREARAPSAYLRTRPGRNRRGTARRALALSPHRSDLRSQCRLESITILSTRTYILQEFLISSFS